VGQQPTGYDGVGNVVGYTDSVMGGWGFSYDPLYRLTAGNATSGSYAGLQASWGYDPFGNRTSESFSGTTQMPMPTSSTASYSTNNQISSSSLMLGAPVQYDASGDVTEDNQNQYLYNGDGRLCAVKSLYTGAMTGYVYGADGTRVSTGTITTWGSCDPSVNGYQATKDEIDGPSGGQLTETGVDANGNVTWAHTNVWVGGYLLATYDTNGIHFDLNDWNGSRRVQTDYEGNTEQTCASLPYGNGEICTPTPSEFLYATLQRDAESGLDHAMYRQYSPVFGQWTVPDPYNGSYSWANPQSLNRYAYVGGNPFAMTDPSGLDGEESCFATDVTITCPLSVGSKLASAVFDTPSLDDFLSAIPFASTAVPLASFAEGIYDLGKSFGWWGGGPTFHGNVNASQSGKNVPSTGAANVPGPSGFDPDDPGYQLAVALGQNGAYTINDWRFPVAFYTASATAAAGVVAAPAVAATATNAIGYGVGYAQGSLATGSGVLLGKYWSEIDNYMLDAENAGLGYFNLGDKGWKIMNALGDPLSANQGFLDAVIKRGIPIYLNNSPFEGGTYGWELQYLFSNGVPNGQLYPAW
jgi:RHS repeat-associated protein